MADMSLLAVTAVWGITFVVIKEALNETSVEAFLFVRFALAFVFLLGYLMSERQSVPLSTVTAGVILGVMLHLAYFFQTAGLQYTSATNAGFITGFNVVMVPILSTVFLRRPPTIAAFSGAVLATIGLMFMAGFSIPQWNRGDILVLVCAFMISVHILFTAYFAPKHNLVALTTVQMGTICFISLAHTTRTGTFPVSMSGYLWGTLLFTAIFCSAVAFLVQTAAQRITTPTRTALTFTMEPVFAVVAAFFVIGEVPDGSTIIGGILILSGMLISQIRPARWSELGMLNGSEK
jgi:drug/metabolite transporter (DMT)-like permease